MTLIKTSVLNGCAVITKMCTQLAINKILAVYLGPAGYGLVGQFQNVVQILNSLSGGAFSTGIVKYTAEYGGSNSAQKKLWQTAGTLSLYCALITTILVAVFSSELAAWILEEKALRNVFLWCAASLILFCANSFLVSILNGNREVKIYVLSNMLGSLFIFISVWVLAKYEGLEGALIGMTVYQVATLIATFYMCRKLDWVKFSNLIGKVDRLIANKLARYAAMAGVSALCGPLTYIFIRNHLNKNFGIEYGGYWEAGMRISSAFLLFFTTTLSIYLIPKISAIERNRDLPKVLLADYKYIGLFALLASVPVYVFRVEIVELLYSKEFLPTASLILYILVADNLKIAAFMISYSLIARSSVIFFTAGEIMFSIIYYILVVLLTERFGFHGAVIAGAVNYVLYFGYMAVGFRKLIGSDDV